MAVIKAKQLPKKKAESAEEILARFCYHFQQYTYSEARKLPYKRVVQLLKAAQKEQAKEMIVLTHIASAPHSRKGKLIKKVLDYLNRVIEG